jgi:hypothetical protein
MEEELQSLEGYIQEVEAELRNFKHQTKIDRVLRVQLHAMIIYKEMLITRKGK